MPFIDTKVTMKVTPEKKEIIKQELGKRISALNKTETYLMVGMEDWVGLRLLMQQGMKIVTYAVGALTILFMILMLPFYEGGSGS